MSEPETKQLTEEAMTEIETRLAGKYFMIPKNAWWSFLGGILAFGVAVGVVSYNGALVALTEPAVQKAKTTVFNAAVESEKALETINKNVIASGATKSRLDTIGSDLANKVPKDAQFRLVRLDTGQIIGHMDNRRYQPGVQFLILRGPDDAVGEGAHIRWRLEIEPNSTPKPAGTPR